ncbi:ABC transporter permease [Amylolactobacillus amylotrophicus DSM 20534]|uniref:ABC transporter n=4 Tax=Amylolactobacillus TaxID=2767876 RepID=A0A1L6XCH6_9LACO|nr:MULTISPECIES: metal ABC transporter permease [Amylolactobacillus]APT18673.1 ABC transporter [Amylolactobacillus amylophilus DSM 20533 = JCM 1125]KRK37762.1 ABC transporter permease [Amylolactobacillus amylotrophicus DSM 20534]KRM41550.1 ABC transporter permease [Amylolactobacillus amylophilus DSM 20533 = JCM 1125]GED80780.1 ABC transporter permease [Amylolactobacillus amylophilus]
MFAYDFMRYAFLASTFIAITTGVVGVFVVARNLSFLAHTLSEIGFAGAAFAVFLGISPLWGMLLFTLLGSVGVGGLSLRTTQKESSISAISALFIGLGILFLSISSSSSRYATSILFGSIIGVDLSGVTRLVILSVVVLFIIAIFYRGLKFTSFDYLGAQAHRLKTNMLSVIFLIVLAMSVSVGSQIVGSMLVFILLTLPASTAKFLGKTVPQMIAWSVGLALAGVWGGLLLGYLTNLPVTFFISAIEVIFYLIVYVYHLKHN